MTENSFPKVDGDILYASETNAIASRIKELYTGNGYDTSATYSGAPVTDDDDYELTAVTASGINGASYVKITFTVNITHTYTSGTVPYGSIKAQIKETGGAYGDILAFQKINVPNATENTNTIRTFVIISALTAGMKTNGFQVKLFSQCYSGSDAGGSSAITNVQTIEELC